MNLFTPGATKVLGSLTLLGVVGAGWLLALGPTTDELAAVRLETTETRDRNLVLANELVTLQEQAENLDQTRAASAALGRIFPPTADQPGLFEQVTEAAAAAGIAPKDVTTLTPTPPSVDGADGSGAVALEPEAGSEILARQEVSLSINATYEQTRQLLQSLERMPRAYRISSVTLAIAGEPGAYTTTVIGDMFVMAPPVEPEAGLEEPSIDS